MVVDLTCDHWRYYLGKLCKGERRCRAKVAALVPVIRIVVLLGGAGRGHAVYPSWVKSGVLPKGPMSAFARCRHGKLQGPILIERQLHGVHGTHWSHAKS
jgi:hypothetical protein